MRRVTLAVLCAVDQLALGGCIRADFDDVRIGTQVYGCSSHSGE